MRSNRRSNRSFISKIPMERRGRRAPPLVEEDEGAVAGVGQGASSKSEIPSDRPPNFQDFARGVTPPFTRPGRVGR